MAKGLKQLSEAINKCYTRMLITGSNILYRRSYKKLHKLHPSNSINKKELEYKKRWKRLSRHTDINTFRLFSQYIGPDPNIVPEDICAGIIQPILNPIETRPYYQDKNMFEKILPSDFLPVAILRKIKGEYYDRDFNPVDITNDWLSKLNISSERIFVKPATDSSSGVGVVSFKRIEDRYYTSDGKQFNCSFLNEYSKDYDDFIVQEGLTQHKYISQFNPTSINTIRIATYRSVKDNQVHVCAIIMRIGKIGSDVDNAHAGGLFVGVGKDGTIGSYACDQNGNKYSEFNGIDFENNCYKIPDFNKIMDFAVKVGQYIPHHRLLAQDIAITKDGSPRLVEFNLRGFSTWLFQFTSGPALGEYTDEVINYCATKKKNITKVFVEPF